MTDHTKPFRFEVSIDGFAGLSFESPTTVIATGRSTDQPLLDWYREVLDRAPAEPYKRDLVMRETDLEPGVHENADDPADVVMVVRHTDGTRRAMLWFDHGDGAAQAEPGDLVFRGCWIKSMRQNVDADPGVEIVELGNA